MKSRQWDIFCKVIDNFGDIGICWRLSADLASRGEQVRLWVDDASALAWMAPTGLADVEVLCWSEPLSAVDLQTVQAKPGDVLIEAFGCNPPPEFMAACALAAQASGRRPVWINLEYLSAERYAQRNHHLPSPVRAGPAAGWTKWFFYPGFTAETGGLLREPDLEARRSRFDRTQWLKARKIPFAAESLVSMFCYEPAALEPLLQAWAERGLHGRPVRLLVAAGRAGRAVSQIEQKMAFKESEKAKVTGQKRLQPNTKAPQMLSISYLPLLTQTSFDELLWACDLNFVRGEDSIVRAIWAGKPFVWQIYPQGDGAHHAKLDAFLDTLEAPPSWRAFHHEWNADTVSAMAGGLAPPIELAAWTQTTTTAKARLEAQSSLTDRLLGFVEKNR